MRRLGTVVGGALVWSFSRRDRSDASQFDCTSSFDRSVSPTHSSESVLTTSSSCYVTLCYRHTLLQKADWPIPIETYPDFDLKLAAGRTLSEVGQPEHIHTSLEIMMMLATVALSVASDATSLSRMSISRVSSPTPTGGLPEALQRLRGGSTATVDVVLVGCGVPKRGMGWYHAKQMLEGLVPSAQLTTVVEPYFMGAGAESPPGLVFGEWAKEMEAEHGTKFVKDISELEIKVRAARWRLRASPSVEQRPACPARAALAVRGGHSWWRVWRGGWRVWCLEGGVCGVACSAPPSVLGYARWPAVLGSLPCVSTCARCPLPRVPGCARIPSYL